MLALFPGGFEERESASGLELVAYTDARGEASMRSAFGRVCSEPVEPGWQDRWREFHRGAATGPLWVGPPWEPPAAGLLPVIIDPGQAFGTGSHATTRLCVELLAGLPTTSLLDAGCGSGVLAIAAAKLGFGPVWAFDDDPQATAATARNARANGVSLRIESADVLRSVLPAAGTVVANVTLKVVLELADRVPGSVLVTSGYLVSDAPSPSDRQRLTRRELEGWAADVWAPAGQ